MSRGLRERHHRRRSDILVDKLGGKEVKSLVTKWTRSTASGGAAKRGGHSEEGRETEK